MNGGYTLLYDKPAQPQCFAFAPNIPRRLSPSRLVRLLALCLLGLCFIWAVLIVFIALFRPSYTHPPPHYRTLERIALESSVEGRLNPNNERVYIAASLYDPDGKLLGGPWARSVLELIDLLGADNSFLSIYESDSGTPGAFAMREFHQRVPCNSSLVSEPTIELKDPAIITLENGKTTVKRIAYLAEARNRALDALSQGQKFDKILFLNDVFFNPVEAAQLLFATNIQPSGLSRYRAACALDFDNPFKFYDTFASRDTDGYSLGVPLYPWFSAAGSATSRKDVIAQRDAVRVKACWGGMVAFDAQHFQESDLSADRAQQPVRFRVEPDLYWEHSECCLVHADIAEFAAPEYEEPGDIGIYMNPYIRTAYTPTAFRWLNLGRKLEYLLYPIQSLLDIVAGLPFHNDRRNLPTGKPIWKTVWVENTTEPTGGSWEWRRQPANPGGFCGVRHLVVRRPLSNIAGQKNWYSIPVPDSFVEKEKELEDEPPG